MRVEGLRSSCSLGEHVIAGILDFRQYSNDRKSVLYTSNAVSYALARNSETKTYADSIENGWHKGLVDVPPGVLDEFREQVDDPLSHSHLVIMNTPVKQVEVTL